VARPIPDKIDSTTGRSRIGIYIALLVATVVVVESAAGLYLISGPLEGQGEVGKGDKGPISGSTDLQKPDRQASEVDLGIFSIVHYRPELSITTRVTFRLFGRIEKSQKNNFLKNWKENEPKLREIVDKTLREADLIQLTDPGLGLIKKKILAKINAQFGKHPLLSVAITDYSYLEQ
jgi:hypothetical protein